jgi:hypothetical protein
MKTVKLGVCCAIALVFLFGLSAGMVHAQKFDEMWFKTKIKVNIFVGDAGGEVNREREKGLAYLYLFAPLGIPCGGYDYLVQIVAEIDDVWTVIGGGQIDTCNAAETAFWSELNWVVDGISFVQFSNGEVKGDPKLKSKGSYTVADDGSDPTGIGRPPGIAKKSQLNGNDIDCDKLPFADNLGVIGDPLEALPPCAALNGANGG